MTTNLKSTIEELANEFALSIIGALRAASIDEISSVIGGDGRRSRTGALALESFASAGKSALGTRGKGHRLGRRSVADIGRMVDNIVALLERHPDGMRAEQIRDQLRCEAKELPRPLADGLREGRLRKTGQKRATTYFASKPKVSGGARRGARSRA
jgi:hypothetical protein